MKALNSASFFALSCSLRTIAYATAAPAAAPKRVPMIFLAAPSPASEVVIGGATTGIGSVTLLAILGALETTVGAFADPTSLGAALVRELTTLLSSLQLSATVRCHVMTLLCSITVPSSRMSGPFLYTTSILFPSKSSTAALKCPSSSQRVAGAPLGRPPAVSAAV